MRKWIVMPVILLSCTVWAQKNDDIDYYTDSKVKNSRLSLALNLNPNYTDRRLINDEVPSGGGFDLPNENAVGAFQLNYNLDFYYSLGAAFDVIVGFGRSAASYSIDNVQLYQGVSDTINTKLDVDVSMYTIPVRLNFNTSVTDVFDLEVVPVVELTFVDKYDQVFTPSNGSASISNDLSGSVRSINYTVGLALGGTFWIADRWGIIARGNAKYMLNAIIEQDNFPRETPYSFGLDLGLKYSF